MGRAHAVGGGTVGGRVRTGATADRPSTPRGEAPTCGSTRPRAIRSRRSSCRAPRKCPQPGGRWWGVFAPLYALRAEDDWGVGSFSELAAFRGWVDDLGGSVAATLPLFAQFLDEPMVEPSPYSPASRLFWNETYIDVRLAPGLDACEEAREALEDPSFREQIARLRKNELTDHPAIAAAKRRVLDPLAQRGVPRHPPGRARPSSPRTRARPTTRGSARRSSAAAPGGARGRGSSERARSPGRRSMTTGPATTCSSSGWRPSNCRTQPGARARPAG